MYNLIRKITNCISIFSVILIGLGILNLFVYYHSIGIVILPYLQPTEVLLSSINVIPFSALTSSGIIIIIELQFETETFLDKITDRIKNPWLKLLFWLFSWIPIAIVCFAPLILINIPDTNTLLTISGILLCITIYYLVKKKKLDYLVTHGPRLFILLIIISIVMTALFAINSSKQKLVSNCNAFKLVTRDTIYTNSDSLVYYGRTNNFTFLYSKIDSNVVIIPNNLISKETLKFNCTKSK